jgi:hypothetical protein
MAKRTPDSSVRRSTIAANVVAQIVAASLIVVFLNYLAGTHVVRWDLSHGRRYSLSPLSKRVLGNLKNEVRIYLLLSPSAKDAPSQLLVDDVDSLLREYEYDGKRKIRVEKIDPYRDLTRARQLQEKYRFGDLDNLIILDCDGKQKDIRISDLAEYESAGMVKGHEVKQMSAFTGERVLTEALLSLTEDRAPQIVFTSGHGELTPDNPSLSRLNDYLTKQNMQLSAIDLTGGNPVPANVSALVIGGPRYDFSPQALQALNNYWEKDGRVLILLNARAKTPELDKFLTEIGLKPETDLIVTNVRTGIEEESVTLDLYARFESESPFLKAMSQTTGFFPGGSRSIGIDAEKLKGKNLRARKMLVPVLPNYWGEKDDFLATNTDPVFHQGVDLPPPLVAGWSLDRGALEDVRVQVRSSSRMIVLGNADFIRDECLSRAAPDVDFALLCLNWLTERQQLLAISPKIPHSFAIQLRPGQMHQIFWIAVVAMPLAAGVAGLLVWFVRRH